MSDDKTAFVSEVADLLYHLLVLLSVKNVRLDDAVEVLRGRSTANGHLPVLDRIAL